jgi:hypothetical protein
VANAVVMDGPLLRRMRISEGSASSTFPISSAVIAIVKEWPSLQYFGVAVGSADRGPQPRYVNAALDSPHRQLGNN